MGNFRAYSTATWRWVVINTDGDIIADFAAKWEADKHAAEHGGTVKRVRW